jgi:hypothetical protein
VLSFDELEALILLPDPGEPGEPGTLATHVRSYTLIMEAHGNASFDA